MLPCSLNHNRIHHARNIATTSTKFEFLGASSTWNKQPTACSVYLPPHVPSERLTDCDCYKDCWLYNAYRISKQALLAVKRVAFSTWLL
ncbi:hypothetical protein CEXT_628841 [Caerostris extrusa]|uniref:Uncharacterized protein n=1 Tax=Caerostris extrusa TaxID=172846 RepID=A0AAV4P8Z8_CAEEX|nr:hypothetical protein CEXT_628841 [Caerostris extrusa]